MSHRSDAFAGEFKATKKLLCDLTSAAKVEILLGSGSLANDAIGAQISLLGARGLVLSNGEFGDRLIDHATRLGLQFDVYEMEWGEPFDYAESAGALLLTVGFGRLTAKRPPASSTISRN